MSNDIERLEMERDQARTERDELREQLADWREAFAMPDETCEDARRRWHSWQGLMALLDLHWPADIFPTTRCLEEPARDAGPRIVALMRWVSELRASRDKTEAALYRMSQAVIGMNTMTEGYMRQFGLWRDKPAAAAPSQEGESDG